MCPSNFASYSQVSWFLGSIFYYCSPWHIFLSFLLVHPSFVVHTAFPKFLLNVFILDFSSCYSTKWFQEFHLCHFNMSVLCFTHRPAFAVIQHFWFTDSIMKTQQIVLPYVSSRMPSYHFISSIIIYYRLFSLLLPSDT